MGIYKYLISYSRRGCDYVKQLGILPFCLMVNSITFSLKYFIYSSKVLYMPIHLFVNLVHLNNWSDDVKHWAQKIGLTYIYSNITMDMTSQWMCALLISS